MTELIAVLDSLADRVDMRWLLPLGGVVMIHFFAEPSRWRVYLDRHPDIAWSGLLQVFSLTALVGYLLPAKLGLPMRLLLLRRCFGLTLGGISALMVLDGVLYYASWAAAALIGLPWAVGLSWSDGRAVTLLAVALLGAALFLVAMLRNQARLPTQLAEWLGAARRHVGAAMDTLRGWPLYAAVAITLLDILSHVLRHGVLLAMFGHQLPLSSLFSVTALSIFAGLVSLMPMGLGGYDLMLVLLLQSKGISVADAVAVAVVNRLAGFAISSMLGAWGGMALGLGAFNRREWGRLAETAMTERWRKGK